MRQDEPGVPVDHDPRAGTLQDVAAAARARVAVDPVDRVDPV
jgi:hypothetical protein